MRQERALRGAREALGDQAAPDLTFAVRLAAGHSFQAAGMLQEARAAYDKILKSEDVPQVEPYQLMSRLATYILQERYAEQRSPRVVNWKITQRLTTSLLCMTHDSTPARIVVSRLKLAALVSNSFSLGILQSSTHSNV